MTPDEINQLELYAWVDRQPISRKKSLNIVRDFADAVPLVEILKQHLPDIELHNYPPANSKALRLANWSTLNRKVFSRLGFRIEESDMLSIVEGKHNSIEKVLSIVRVKLELRRQSLEETTSPKKIKSSPKIDSTPKPIAPDKPKGLEARVEKLEKKVKVLEDKSKGKH